MIRNIILTALFAIGAVNPSSADEMDPAPAFAKKMTRVIQIISEHHFTPSSEAQLADWSIRGLFENLKEPMPAEIAGRLEKIDKAKRAELHQMFLDARTALKHRKDLDGDRDLEICVEAIAAKIESGSTRMQLVKPPTWIIEIRPGDVGVGLKLESDPKTKMLRVVSPILNGPGYKAGIRAGDIITAIRLDTDRDGKSFVAPDNEGKPAPSPIVVSTKDMTLEQAAQLLRGKAGTRVTLTVQRAK